MPHNRFYSDFSLQDKALCLEGEEFHHLFRVMRSRVGEVVELINGRHLLALAKIQSFQKRSAELTLLKVEEKRPRLPPLTLIQALPKLPLLEHILQKGTELGVSTFYLYSSKLSEKKSFSETQKNRLHHIVIGAMKQCGRLDLPSLEWGLPSPLSHLADQAKKERSLPLKSLGSIYFGDLRESAPPLSTIRTLPATLIIGPEKGFTPSELQGLETVGTGVSLSPYTLRAETAALAGLSILANEPPLTV